ncbi:MAG: DUF3857 domain-containing protein [Bacteroidales bacterium]|jgi:hypothetical protein|nr:DUF3857 domain-containing protein [Bacteroidales bacterium]
MKKIFWILAIVLIINSAFAQEENADAVFLKITKEYRLNEDGSIEFSYSKQLKLLTYYSFHRLYGETFIVYNPDFQELKINKAFIIMADGKVVKTPDNAFNEVLPRFAANIPAYNNLREMVVTHTGLERNAVINLDYTIKNSKEFLPALMGDEILEESSPVKEMIIKVKIPNNHELHYKIFNIRTAPVITSENNMQVFTWIFKNLHARSKESFREQNNLFTPRLEFSSAIDLHRVYDWFVNQPAFYYKVGKQMAETVDNIVAEEKDQMKIILKLQKLVVNNLKYYHIPLVYTGYRCRTAEEIWKSNGGTQLDKSILLTALLRQANINANPVVVIPSKFYEKEIGNLLMFDKFLVQVNPKKYGQLYLSATHVDNQNLKFNLSGNKILLLDYAIESLKTYEEKGGKNEIYFGCGYVIQNPEKLVGTTEIELSGNLNPYLQFFKDSTNAKTYITNGISSKDIKNFQINKLNEYKSEIHYDIEKEDPFVKQDNYLFWNLPVVKNGINSWHINLLTKKRISPLEIPSTIKETYNYTIVLPENMELVNPEANIEIKNEVGNIFIKVQRTNDEILIKRSIYLPEKIIDVNNYKAFKEILNLWQNKKYKEIVFKMK